MSGLMKGRFAGCKWCHGNGCLCCRTERKKAEEAALQPIFTADTNNPRDMERLRSVFGREAIEKAFGPEGGGIREIERNAAIQSLLQAFEKHVNRAPAATAGDDGKAVSS